MHTAHSAPARLRSIHDHCLGGLRFAIAGHRSREGPAVETGGRASRKNAVSRSSSVTRQLPVVPVPYAGPWSHETLAISRCRSVRPVSRQSQHGYAPRATRARQPPGVSAATARERFAQILGSPPGPLTLDGTVRCPGATPSVGARRAIWASAEFVAIRRIQAPKLRDGSKRARARWARQKASTRASSAALGSRTIRRIHR